MWVVTPYGFFSIVQLNDLPTRHVDANVMQIRARNRAHLEALKEAVLVSLPPIRAKGGTDYPYRIITTREKVGQVLIDMAIAIDYVNFKAEAGRRSRGDYAFVDFLHKVWHLGLSLTPGRKPRSIPRLREDTQPGDLLPGGFNFQEVSKKMKRRPDTKT